MGKPTILWHDYETSGRVASRDRPLQFGAIRTDEELNEVGDPVTVRARLAADVLPDPEACLVTGVVPGDFPGEEVSELKFARVVRDAMSTADTCTAGYNSIRFDDEFTRYLFWRCLLPVYDREWKNGNSRWDLIDAMRAAHALRPDGIEWPRHDNGKPSFRLGDLAAANGIEHGGAHDALADVRMTIELARLLRRQQPRLFGFLFDNRTKRAVTAALQRGMDDGAPLVHTSSRFDAEAACTSVVVPIAAREDIGSQIIVLDLRHDPAVLLEHDPELLREALYTRRDQLPEDAPRVGVATVHSNRAPVVAPMGVLDDASWDRIRLDRGVVEARLAWVAAHREQLVPILQFLCIHAGEGDPDPETSLYGGFVPAGDQRLCAEVHERPPAAWRAMERRFRDHRLGELLFRLRCREAPETLDAAERERWQEHVRARLLTPLDSACSRLDTVRAELGRLRTERAADAAACALLDRVAAVVDERTAALA